jgi:hypothetical protein
MKGNPYTDVATHLRDELQRAWLRIEYQIRAGWRNEVSVASGRVQNVVLDRDEVAKLFVSWRGHAASENVAGAEQALKLWLEDHAHVEARIQATLEATQRSPLVELIRVFGLSQRQWATLMYAVLPEIDPNLVQA